MPQCGDVEGESRATHLFKQGFETGSPVDRTRNSGPLSERAAVLFATGALRRESSRLCRTRDAVPQPDRVERCMYLRVVVEVHVHVTANALG